MQTESPIVKDIVLIGGGHSHVTVLKRFGMRPLPGARLTMVSREVHTPYSGMLPGLIAGHYDTDAAHIDLAPLCRFASARLYHDEVIGLDLDARLVLCRNRPPIHYDVLSIDVGSSPNTDVPGAKLHSIAVKPVSDFSQRWEEALARILARGGPQRVGVIGAGAGGVELLFALRHRLQHEFRRAALDVTKLSFHLICRSADVLPTHNDQVRAIFDQALTDAEIEVITNQEVMSVDENSVELSSGTHTDLDEIFWVTTASAQPWLKHSGLAVDEQGFVRVNETLESVSHAGVFAAGDVAAVDKHPRPKSGVFAVRQGRPLANNLRRCATNRSLKPFRPQAEFLSLISTGNRYAVGSRGQWAIQGKWVWRWKDWIDRRFMRKYRDLPDMSAPKPPTSEGSLTTELRSLQSDPMRCGGCGSKVGADILHEALATLPVTKRDDVIIGLADPDDAAVVVPRPGTVLVQTVDAFRDFIDDPYRFGQIAANHCLSDIFAMGATPQTALALVTLPLASPASMRRDLTDLMTGALKVFAQANTAIVGGHTNEGSELSLGFAINGYIEPDALRPKAISATGDQLILTKALGTGALFAADMRGKAKARWVQEGVDSMLLSNEIAADILRDCGAAALTDVTGFGLYGHLLEMLRPNHLCADVTIDAFVAMDGVLELLDEGIVSSLHESNQLVESQITVSPTARHAPRYQLGFDPQTSGGLLAAVPADQATGALERLRGQNYPHARIIGTIVEADGRNGPGLIRIVT